MREQLLQFIWRHQYFNTRELTTTKGEPLCIVKPGTINRHQGPDFLDASIRIGNECWAGNVELHIRSSGWNRHAHQHDRLYQNVILHVVWEDDRPVINDRELPVLVLGPRVPKLLLAKYNEWMNTPDRLPCAGQLASVPEEVWESWKSRLLKNRMKRRHLGICEGIKETRGDWETVCWRKLAYYTGAPVNAAAFEAMARGLPLNMLRHYRDKPLEMESLFLGKCGLLEGDFHEPYPLELQRCYRHLRRKYSIEPTTVPVLFMRLRPVNFPAVRLSQLAALLSKSSDWFGLARDAGDLNSLRKELSIAASGYWDDHYSLERASPVCRRKYSGAGLSGRLLINVLIPMIHSYGILRHDRAMTAKAHAWMNEISPEENSRIRTWKEAGVPIRNGAQSQSLLELSDRYCDLRGCLQCAIGKYLLGKEPPDQAG